jgi:DNA-binding beta-propeller fold protein YncE
MKMNTKTLVMAVAAGLSFASCTKSIEPIENRSLTREESPGTESMNRENPGSFALLSSIDLGNTGAAEISAYDDKTKKLFVVNNSAGNSRIDVLDFSDPSNPVFLTSISVATYGGFVNSVAAHDGSVAAAIEAITKTDAGKVVVFKATDYTPVKVIGVGALPDDIKYSPDGKFIVTANEGEPNSNYTIDPLGTISIISVKDNYQVTTLDFAALASMEAGLKSRGFRIFGPGASFAQDIEPEFIAISSDSKTAWVTLQENNGIAKVNLVHQVITDIFPLGFKNYNMAGNAIDPTDRPLGTISLNQWPVYGVYMPDGIAVLDDKVKGDDDDEDEDIALNKGKIPYLFTANEGDAREYTGFEEEARVSSLNLNPVVFPNAAFLKLNENMGRLNITKTLGDAGNDNIFDALYSFGARSFSVWNGNSGEQMFDTKNELEQRVINAGYYDDDRSDSKGAEPEGIAVGTVGKSNLVFVGLERADAVAIYDVTNPVAPRFLQILATGDAPEGVLFIPAKKSPNRRSLLVVSSENDGQVKVYMPDRE